MKELIRKKPKKVHVLPKPIKVDWSPKPIPVEIPAKREEVKKNAND
jgi:hypothetical protein